MNQHYEEYLVQKRAQYGSKFSDSGLASQFIPYYHTGQRITVEFVGQDGEVYEVRRGTVGASTGWRPCFLLMASKRSIGSSWTLSAKDRISTMERWREFRKEQVGAR